MRIETIQELVKAGKVRWTIHAREKAEARGITEREVIIGIINGEIIEEYPNDYPYPSCLIWSNVLMEKIIHIVVGICDEYIRIITVYIPNETKFEANFKIRRGK